MMEKKKWEEKHQKKTASKGEKISPEKRSVTEIDADSNKRQRKRAFETR